MTHIIRRRFVPPTDIIEQPDRLLIISEIAGMHPDDIQITLLSGRVIIRGERRRTLSAFTALHQLEIGFGEFRLEFPLPWGVDEAGVSATYEDGFLMVTLPRRQERVVPVRDAKATDASHDEQR